VGQTGAEQLVARGWKSTVRDVEFAEEPSMSTTGGPEASGQDEPDPREAEKPERHEKSSPGVEIGMMPEGEGSSFEPEEDPETQS
jgi:hypothetical protein